MEEGKEEKKMSCSERQKIKRGRRSLFEWSKEEELVLLKKLVEFSTNNIPHEEFYPFLRNGSLAEVPKIQIFDKIQQLKNKYLEDNNGDEIRDDEGFELSKRLWGEEEEDTETTTEQSCKALDMWNMSHFERLFESHGVESDLFTPSFLEATKREVDELFCLQNQHLLNKANLNQQLAQLKHHIIQTRFKNHTNSHTTTTL